MHSAHTLNKCLYSKISFRLNLCHYQFTMRCSKWCPNWLTVAGSRCYNEKYLKKNCSKQKLETVHTTNRKRSRLKEFLLFVHLFCGLKKKIRFHLLYWFAYPFSSSHVPADVENDDGNFPERGKIQRKIKILYKATTQQNNYSSISSIFSIVIKVSRHSRNATNTRRKGFIIKINS